MTTLNLTRNLITQSGMEYLANALKTNTVRSISLFIDYFIKRTELFLFSQTLTSLYLGQNSFKSSNAHYLFDDFEEEEQVNDS